MDDLRQLIALLQEAAGPLAAGVTWLIGLATGPEVAQRFALAVQLDALAGGVVRCFLLIGALLLSIGLLERLTRSKPVAYASRTFRQDVLYILFYGSFYKVLILSALAAAVQSRLDFLKIDVLASLALPVQWVLYLLSLDFLTYWWHRWLHTSKLLWDIHSVHHSQLEMSCLTTYRLHPLEQLIYDLIMIAPFLLIGVPASHGLPIMVVWYLLDGAQHSALDWDYGRGYRLLVSPRFHALHHSADPRHHNKNFSKILSVWDFIFGTAVWQDRRPERFGVEGMPVPQTLGAQLLAPFRLMAQRLSRRASPAAAAESPR